LGRIESELFAGLLQHACVQNLFRAAEWGSSRPAFPMDRHFGLFLVPPMLLAVIDRHPC